MTCHPVVQPVYSFKMIGAATDSIASEYPLSLGGTLYSLQIGRALAALMVVIAHASMATIFLYPDMPEHANALLKLGHYGVDYFFVLSGFIIAHATSKLTTHDVTDAKRYILARLIRIYPPYLPISMMMLAAFMFFPSMSMGDGRSISWLGSILLLPSEATPALIVARTLQHEIVFYVLYGLCYFYLRRPFLIYLWVVPIFVQMLMAWREPADILMGSINLEFLFGLSAYHCYQRAWFYKKRYFLFAFGIFLVSSACYWLLHGAMMANSRLLAGAGFAFVVLGAVYLERHYRFSQFKFLVFLGAASYSIYLIHLAVISLWMRLALPLPSWQVSCSAIIVLSTAVGVIYFLLLEKPLLRAMKRKSKLASA